MKYVRIILLLALTVLLSSACNATDEGIMWFGEQIEGSGTASKEVRSFERLRGVHLATIGDLRVQQGEKNELVIEADENLLQFFVTEVRDGILKIDIEDSHSLRPKSPVRYTLTVESLEVLRASSSGDIFAKTVKGDRVDIALSSSGDIAVNRIAGGTVALKTSSSGDLSIAQLSARTLRARISSSGDMTIEDGKVDEMEVSISSSGDFVALKVECGEADISTSSSGDARVWVTDRLDASTSSSGSIFFRGDPRVTAHESSSGDVERLR